jgi:XRE family aerobic/anaerobic benzoate catabolism transcriptional regulator
MHSDADDRLLGSLGQRLRAARTERGWTQRELAGRAGLSSRFIAQVEAGQGNIALTRLATLSRALGLRLDQLVGGLEGSPPTECGVIALLGLRGAGKSALGLELAGRLGVPFVEQDDLVEEAAGMRRAEIFAIHGEDYYTELARRTLDRLLAEAPPGLVLATTGGVVTDPESLEQLRRRARTVWLRARSEDHWRRVLAQGDFRPMQDRPDAFGELERLLARREPLYALAHHTVDTSALGRQGALEALEALVRAPEGAVPGGDEGR